MIHSACGAIKATVSLTEGTTESKNPRSWGTVSALTCLSRPLWWFHWNCCNIWNVFFLILTWFFFALHRLIFLNCSHEVLYCCRPCGSAGCRPWWVWFSSFKKGILFCDLILVKDLIIYILFKCKNNNKMMVCLKLNLRSAKNKIKTCLDKPTC